MKNAFCLSVLWLCSIGHAALGQKTAVYSLKGYLTPEIVRDHDVLWRQSTITRLNLKGIEVGLSRRVDNWEQELVLNRISIQGKRFDAWMFEGRTEAEGQHYHYGLAWHAGIDLFRSENGRWSLLLGAGLALDHLVIRGNYLNTQIAYRSSELALMPYVMPSIRFAGAKKLGFELSFPYSPISYSQLRLRQDGKTRYNQWITHSERAYHFPIRLGVAWKL